MTNWILDHETNDALTELMNIGVGRAAASLSELIGQRIELNVPQIHLCRTDDCPSAWFGELNRSETVISQTFAGVVEGKASLCFPAESSVKLARLLAGNISGSLDGLDAELSGILLEVGNIVLNGVLGSLANALQSNLNYGLPQVRSIVHRAEMVLFDALRQDDVLIGNVRFSVADQQIEGSIVIVYTIGSIARMLDAILAPAAS